MNNQDSGLSTERILITGAAGYIGRHLVENLSRDGHRIIAQTLHPIAPDFWSFPPEEVHSGDLSDPRAADAAAKDCSLCIYCAGPLENGQQAAYFQRHIYDALQQFLRFFTGRRLIYLSSIAVYGLKPHHDSLEESAALDTDTPYGDMKLRAEELLTSQSLTLPIIFRPGLVWGGKHDQRFFGRLFASVSTGRFVFPGPCTAVQCWCFLPHLEDAIRLAIDWPGTTPLICNISPEQGRSFREFMELLCLTMSRTCRFYHAPLKPLRVIAGALETLWRLTRLPGWPSLNVQTLEQLNIPLTFSNRCLHESLGFRPRYTLETAIAEQCRMVTSVCG